jgi:hypothetical protein
MGGGFLFFLWPWGLWGWGPGFTGGWGVFLTPGPPPPPPPPTHNEHCTGLAQIRALLEPY